MKKHNFIFSLALCLLWGLGACNSNSSNYSLTNEDLVNDSNVSVKNDKQVRDQSTSPSQGKEIKTYNLGTLQFQMQGEPLIKVEQFVVDAYTSLSWNTPSIGTPALAMAFKGPNDQSGYSVILNGPATAQEVIRGTFPISAKAPSRVQIAMRWGADMEHSFSIAHGDAEIEQLSRDGVVKLVAKGKGIYGNIKDPSKMRDKVPCTFSVDCQLRDVIVDGEYVRKDGEMTIPK